jgi:NADPH-dependent curcumin reductase CurA
MVLDATLARMNAFGRIALCGMISGYDGQPIPLQQPQLLDEIAGTLVGLDADEVVVARDDARAGRVHVHFPRIGFHVKAAKKEL